MQSWYLARNGKRQGPYSLDELKEMVRKGQLRPEEFVLSEGSAKWVAASSVLGLPPPKANLASRRPHAGMPSTKRLHETVEKSPIAKGLEPKTRWLAGSLGIYASIVTVAGVAAGWFYLDAASCRQRFNDNEYLVEQERLQASEAKLSLHSAQTRLDAATKRANDLEQRNHARALQIGKLQEELNLSKKNLEKETANSERRAKDEARRWQNQVEETKKKWADDIVRWRSQVEETRRKGEEDARGMKDGVSRLQKKAEDDAQVIKKLQSRLKSLESSRGPFSSIDRYALAANASVEASMEDLVRYLTWPTFSEKERFRAVFRWTTDRIAYNAKGLFESKLGDNSADGVFKSRVAVCAGYANLLKKLGDLAGLEVQVVSGYGKGYGYGPWENVSDRNHSWNAVKLDGDWQLVDATWCAGGLKDKEYAKNFRETFFLTPPQEFLTSHLPEDSRWQLLQEPLAPKVAEKLLRSKINPLLFRFGFKMHDVVGVFDKDAFPSFVDVLHEPKVAIQIEAPIVRIIKHGRKTRIKIEAHGIQSMAWCNNNNNKWVEMAKAGTAFQGEIVPVEGLLLVGLKTTLSAKSYTPLLRYFVE